MQLRQALGQIERLQQAIEAMRRQHEQAWTVGRAVPGVSISESTCREGSAAVAARVNREFALVLLAIDRIEAMRQTFSEAAVQRIVEMMEPPDAHQHPRDGCAVPSSGTAASRSCCPASAWRPPMRMGICAAPAPPRWWVQDGRSLGFEIGISIASFPHTAATLAELNGPRCGRD